MIREENIIKAIDEAYKECGSNAYFGEGFRKGVQFAMDHYLQENYNTKDSKVRLIESAIIKEFGFNFLSLSIKNRGGKQLLSRQTSMYLLLKYSSLNQTEIGDIFKRDHSTVIHSRDTIINLIDTDKQIKAIVSKLEEEIK